MLKVGYSSSSWINHLIWNLMAGTHLKKVGTGQQKARKTGIRSVTYFDIKRAL